MAAVIQSLQLNVECAANVSTTDHIAHRKLYLIFVYRVIKYSTTLC